ncbi:hypothetical protein EZV62_012397 [Acer yangbiense]|uniref:DUF659 domain-containing protein n=1 Tax=Acer yangbiense TaxID=1000413 RepID=A0A5C7HW55_9ROSI|nr:hypothetical protein EZV62_012397 [Acer yangbiense]
MDKFASKMDPESSMSASKWVYKAGISFNAIQNNSFRAMMEVVGLFGLGYKESSRYQLSESILKEETDRKRRSIMNLYVNCCKGTIFLSSKESFDEAHTRELIFKYVDKCIEQVRPQNVVQVMTNNASNNIVAAKMLKEKRPSIFWSSCAPHTINLMLEATGPNGMTQPQRSARVQKPKRTLEEEFESEDEPVEEDDFKFEFDEEQVLKSYGEKQKE